MGQRLTKLEALEEEALEHMRHGRYRQYRDALARLLVARLSAEAPGPDLRVSRVVTAKPKSKPVQHALFADAD